MERPPEILKSSTNRLASMAITEDGLKLTKLLSLTGLLTPSLIDNFDRLEADDVNDVSAGQANSERVGIWERRSESGESFFVRRNDLIKEWRLWANVGRIDPKGTKRRIVLIGESVARGYLYDPLFTPAMALEKILQFRLGRTQVEVIDLARTNLGVEVNQLAKSAYLLEPDAIVIFAGNNWRSPYGAVKNLRDIAGPITVLREQGIGGLKRHTEDRIEIEIKQRVKEIASFYQDKGIPVVWIIPEFNLGDWRDPQTNAPYLPKEANREWLTCLERANRALQMGDFENVTDLAEKMVELDGGVCATGLYLLAECSGQRGKQDDARRYLEMARDALIWNFIDGEISPRPYTIVQETLRRETRAYNNSQIDLPEIFKNYLGEGMPDRRLFLDYCHLNSEGIQIVMANAAAALLKLMDGIDVSWATLKEERIAPKQEVEGEAAFLAAIHNAHWWQSYDVIYYYCLRAIEKSPKITQVMTQFIDLQSRRSPMLMCKSAEIISSLGSPLIQNYLLRSNTQRLDKLLIDAIVSALAKAGVDIREWLDQLRQSERSVTHKDIDLLEFYYCSAAQQPQELAWSQAQARASLRVTRHNYYRAYSPESRFVFIGKADCPVALRLTCRLTEAAGAEETIFIEVNKKRVAEETVGSKWITREITVNPEIVLNGLNEVIIHWPIPGFSCEKAIEEAAQDLTDGNYPEFFPVFGEIHSFGVRRQMTLSANSF